MPTSADFIEGSNISIGHLGIVERRLYPYPEFFSDIADAAFYTAENLATLGTHTF